MPAALYIAPFQLSSACCRHRHRAGLCPNSNGSISCRFVVVQLGVWALSATTENRRHSVTWHEGKSQLSVIQLWTRHTIATVRSQPTYDNKDVTMHCIGLPTDGSRRTLAAAGACPPLMTVCTSCTGAVTFGGRARNGLERQTDRQMDRQTDRDQTDALHLPLRMRPA